MTDLAEQLDLFSARSDRDAALSQVEEHGVPWMDYALAMLRRLPHGWLGTSEDFRAELWSMGIEQPHHHNAWGALTMHGVRQGLLVATGEWRSMQGPKSHARKTPVYRLNR